MRNTDIILSTARDPYLKDTTIIHPSQARSSRRRDHRLDFWRGLCLIDMVLVHLVYERVQFGDSLHAIIGSYTRFAAGGYVFISGLGVGAIFLPRAMKDSNRAATYLSLWRRSFYVLCVQFISAGGFILLDSTRGLRPEGAGFWGTIRNILLLREGGDLLPFYVMMLALAPLFLEILRRSGGAAILAVASLGLFYYGESHPWAFAIAAHQAFPPILWQSVFIAGLVAGKLLPRYDELAQRTKISIATVSWIAYSLLFISEFSSNFGLPGLNLGVGFVKVPLSAGESLRYLTMVVGIMTATDLLWSWIGSSLASKFAQTLGRKSLPVYVAHVWLVEGVAYFATKYWWLGKWEILLGVLSVAALWGFALMLEAMKNPVPRPVVQPAWQMGRPMSASDSMAA
jgi:hypothetical protein